MHILFMHFLRTYFVGDATNTSMYFVREQYYPDSLRRKFRRHLLLSLLMMMVINKFIDEQAK